MSASTFTAAPKRRWLTFSLRTLLAVTLALSLVLGYFGRAWLKAYRASQPPTLLELADIARRHGIPMPPKEAKLVLQLASRGKARRGPLYKYTPAFLIREDADSVVTLCGSQEVTSDKGESPEEEALWWREFPVTPVTAETDEYWIDFSPSSALLCAVQLHERGDTDAASELLGEVLKSHQEYTPVHGDVAVDPTDLRLTMARCAYANYARQLRTQPNRWPDLRTRLEALLAEFPKLRQEPCGAVCRDLALAVDARTPVAGSVEIPLIDWSRRDAGWTVWGPFSLMPLDEESEADPDYVLDAPARQILLRGFEAAPQLIALCQDQRLTVHSERDEDDGTPQFRRLGELAGDLLQEISGFEHGGDALSVPFSDEEREPDAAAWQKWYELAQAQGEQQYYLANLRQDDGQLRESMLYILAYRYPESLFGLISDHFHSQQPQGNVFEFVGAIRDANMPQQQRIELLVALFHRAPKAEHQSILCALAKLDQQRAAHFVLQLLDESPVDIEDEYKSSPEAELAVVVTMLGDERVWRELLKAARRAKAGLRFEMLANIAYRNPNQRLRAYRLALLAEFLDDETVVRNPYVDFGRFDPYRHEGFHGSIRDFVTEALAWSLGMEQHPELQRTADQWSALREQVRERLQQEKLPALE
jgi:hypothetical protein